MRTRVSDLVVDAIANGTHTTASDGRWKCRINTEMNTYVVTHHKTDMLVFDATTGHVYPLDPGWGSQTDKQGITAILGELARGGHNPSARSYHDLYSGKPEQSTRVEGPPTKAKEEPKPKLEPFEPPLTVEDTIV